MVERAQEKREATPERMARAETLVKDHALMATAAGVIPAPGLDLAAGVAIQLALLKRLCNLYGVPFSDHIARGAVATVLGGIGAGALGIGVFMSAVKLIPGVGTLAGVVSIPIALGAVTYALGKMFIAHLEVGGILADFRPGADRSYLRDMVRRGRQAAEDLLSPGDKPREPAKP